MIDPEAFETALVDELTPLLTSWDVKVNDYKVETPGSAIVEFVDSERTYAGAEGDPRTSRPSAPEATVNLTVTFVTDRQAARGTLGELDSALMRACANLRESRREEWLFHRFDSIEQDPEAENPTRVLVASIEVRLIIS